ncbi:hypothetical protein Tco_0236431 [Tanacetum coccineum]
MASQDARLYKFEADFKRHQGEMTNKIDTVLKAITDQIAGTLPSDTVKNPKLGTHPISLQQPVVEIKPQQLEEPELTLEDEFKDLHLNLTVLEVLAHALIYIAILDKYVESLELGKNRSAFVQGETPERWETPGYSLYLVGEGITWSVFGVKGVDLGKEEAPYWTTLGKRESYKPRPSSDRIGEKPPYYARKDFLDFYLPGEWEISRDAELNPFKDTLVFRRMVEFLGAIPINLMCNM